MTPSRRTTLESTGSATAPAAPLAHTPTTLFPWLALLPIAVLAWPFFGAPLEGDPLPHLSGAGWAALAALPLALVLPSVRVTAPHTEHVKGLSLLLVLWAFVAIATLFGHGPDPLEAQRTLVTLSVALVAFTGGALLDTAGRRLVARGVVVASLVWTGGALVRHAFGIGDELAGVLGNTGTLSQAALPGAAIGAWYVATRRGIFWFAGLVAFTLFLAHTGLAPVHAGGISLIVVLLCTSFVSPLAREHEQVRRRVGMLAAFSVFAMVALRGVDSSAEASSASSAGAPTATDATNEVTSASAAPEAPADSDAPDASADAAGTALEVGGAETRMLVWRSLLGVFVDRPFLGLGPGQFQACYPPYRDAREIELSRGGRCGDASTDVQHAHNDYLGGLAELGLVAGTVWLAFLFLVARAAYRAMCETDFPSIGIGVGSLALLVNACFHTPLTYGPASSAVAFLLFGAALARERATTGVRTRRTLRLSVAAVGLLAGVLGWPMIRHGVATTRYIETVAAIDHLDPAKDTPADAERLLRTAKEAVGDALDAEPSSALARTLAARLSETADDALAAWTAAEDVRPYSTTVLEALASLDYLAGRFDAARAHWERALALSAWNPRILEALIELELLHGDRERGLAYLARVGACMSAEAREALGAYLVLAGRTEDGTDVLLGARLDTLRAEELFARSTDDASDDDENTRGALRSLAHLIWAREQVAANDLATALRSYRQAIAPTRTRAGNGPGGAVALRAEYGAALRIAGQADEAADALGGIELDDTLLEALPAWARDTLAND